jgi:hypothetical protein
MKKIILGLVAIGGLSVNCFAGGVACDAMCYNGVSGAAFSYVSANIQSYGTNLGQALTNLQKAADTKCGASAMLVTDMQLKDDVFSFDINKACKDFQ